MRITTARFFAYAIALIIGVLPHARSATAAIALHDHQHPRVLVLHAYHQGLPWTDSVHAGIVAGLGSRAQHLDIYVEYLDALRNPLPDDAARAAFVDRLEQRYRGTIDYLVATDDPAYRLLLAERDRIWPEKPLLFAGVNIIRPQQLDGIAGVAGVAETPDFMANLVLMQELHPRTRRLVVIGDATATFTSNLAALDAANARLATPFVLEVIARRQLADVLAATERISGDSLVFLMARPLDNRGNLVSGPEVASILRQRLDRPIYSAWSFYSGYGIVGGRLVSGDDQGRALAGLLGGLIDGRRLDELPRLIESPNRYVFDHRELARFGLRESQLPDGALILNRPTRIWETNPRLAVAAASLMLLLVALVAVQAGHTRRNRRLAAALERELTLIETLMNATPIPLFYKDASMRYRRINEAFSRFLGKTREEILGETVSKVAAQPHATTYRNKDEELMQQGGQQVYETHVAAADGTLHDIVFHKAVVRLADGSKEGIVGAMLDVTELRRNEAALRELNLSLEERVAERTAELTTANIKLQNAVDSLALAQDELIRTEKLASLGSMVAGVAHELNTPIGNSLTVATTLQDEFNALCEEIAQGTVRRSRLDGFLNRGDGALVLLVRNLERAAQLIANFKEVAVDQTSDRRRRFALAEVVRENVEAFAAGAAGPLPRFVVDIDAAFSLDSYPGALGQICLNLFENARIHAFADPAAGEVRIAAHAAGQGRVQIDISDNGKGIPADALPRIFDPFYTTRMGMGGSGLGLAIVYRLATQTLGGRLRVSSREGLGTIFMLDIPLEAPLAGPKEKPAETVADDAGRPPQHDLPPVPIRLRDELLDIRELVESHAAGTAARNATDLDRYHLRHIFERLDAAFGSDDVEAQIESDLAFHVAIIEATHDPALRKVGDAVVQLMYGHIRRNLDRLMPDPQTRMTLRSQHRRMYEAIIAHDAVAAAAAAAEHMAFVREQGKQGSC